MAMVFLALSFLLLLLCKDISDSFNSAPVLAVYQMPEKKRERNILKSEEINWSQGVGLFGHRHLTTYIEILYISCNGIGITYLSVQDPFAVVPASDEKSGCQQEYRLRWYCHHKTFGWLGGVAQFCHMPCSFVS